MLSKLVRIGRDAEIKTLPSGTSLMSFPVAYDIGYGDKKRTQWLDCVMFGERVHKLAEYITKGKQLVIHADDVGVEEWQKNDGTGTGFKLSCKIVDVSLVSDGAGQSHTPPQPAAQRSATPQPAQSMDSFDPDIPF